MNTKIWLLNSVLLLGVVFSGSKAYQVWTSGGEWQDKTDGPVKASAAPLPRAIGGRMAPQATYSTVTERNLFSPDRRPAPALEEKVSKVEEKPVNISGKQLVLYGIVLAGEHRSAMVSNILQKSGDKATTWVKAGDTIGDLRVLEILPDRIRLVTGGNIAELLLHDASNKRTRETAPNEVGPVKPTVVVAGQERKPDKPKVAPPPPPAVEEGWEIVETPFGPVKRKKR